MAPDRLSRIAMAVLTFCAVLVLAPSRIVAIWHHAQPIVRLVFFAPVLVMSFQVLAFATHRRWLLVAAAALAALVGAGSIVIGGVSVIIATFTGNLDVITSFFVVGVYAAVVAAHLVVTLLRVAEPVAPGE